MPDKTLESEIIDFVKNLPYWAQYTSKIVLNGESIQDHQYDKIYEYLLEDGGIKSATFREKLDFEYLTPPSSLLDDSYFIKISDLKGVNALVEKQSMKINNQLTVIYGENGSGKSGYIRLFKKAFFCRDSKDDIIPNIHLSSPKSVNATFGFKLASEDIELSYPQDKDHEIFNCFSVFDNKCISVYLNEKNELLYRPHALTFFSNLADAYKAINQRLNNDISYFDKSNPFIAHYSGDTEISKLITSLSSKTEEKTLLKYIPYTDEDSSKKAQLESKKAALLLLKKETAIKELTGYREALEVIKRKGENINKLLTKTSIIELNSHIGILLEKQKIANQEGVEKFKTDAIKSVGTEKWKSFIIVADDFVKLQGNYPTENCYCIYCLQKLTPKSVRLIENYSLYLKSKAEEDLKIATYKINDLIKTYSSIDINLIPSGSTLEKWMNENHLNILEKIKEELNQLGGLVTKIIKNLNDKLAIPDNEKMLDIPTISGLINGINHQINTLTKQVPSEEISKVEEQILFYSHKEMLNRELENIKRYLFDKRWVEKAKRISISTRIITETEKALSSKYYNSQYVKLFNTECANLDGNFGIEITSTSSVGKSEKKLQLKGKSPYIILSEGEQKVISLADFLSEIRMSKTNRGIIFDDPVTSLDNLRKRIITERLLKETPFRQVIIFTHDLVFLSIISEIAEREELSASFHRMEKRGKDPGFIWNDNSPANEDKYSNNTIPIDYWQRARAAEDPDSRDEFVRNGITAMRTCYEILIIKEVLCDTVKRFTDRLSIERFKTIVLPIELRDEVYEAYGLLCRYMEGHSHSDEYASHIPPTTDTLKEEIDRYDSLKKKIKNAKKIKSV